MLANVQRGQVKPEDLRTQRISSASWPSATRSPLFARRLSRMSWRSRRNSSSFRRPRCVVRRLIPGPLVRRACGLQSAIHHDQLLPIRLLLEQRQHGALFGGSNCEVALQTFQELIAEVDACYGRAQMIVEPLDGLRVQLQHQVLLRTQRFLGDVDVRQTDCRRGRRQPTSRSAETAACRTSRPDILRPATRSSSA